MDFNYNDKVHFHNPICPFSYRICTAREKDRCLPIQAYANSDWLREADKRAKYCNYRGLILTKHEADSRELPVKKADECKYLIL